MTTAELKTLKISGQTVFAKMQAWGWCDASGREIPWTNWISRKGPSQIGHENSKTVPAQITKTPEERGASTRGEWRILRTSSPVWRDR